MQAMGLAGPHPCPKARPPRMAAATNCLAAATLSGTLGPWAQRDLKECVWRAYKHLLLLGKDNAI